jgi:hypothetical protein
MNDYRTDTLPFREQQPNNYGLDLAVRRLSDVLYSLAATRLALPDSSLPRVNRASKIIKVS